MSFKIIGGGSSLDNVVNDLNQNIRELQGQEVTKIFKDDTGTRRVLLGKGPLGYGLFVSPEGEDVYTTTAPDLVFNSSQNVFKVVQSGTLDLTQASVADPGVGNYASGSGTLGTVTHGLGYTPAYLAFLEFTSGVRALLPWDSFSSPGATQARWDTYYAASSATSFFVQYRITVNGMGAATFALPVSVKYYLLQESAV